MADAFFCRKCGRSANGSCEISPRVMCPCGNILMQDATFCRKCGRPAEDGSEITAQIKCSCGNELLPDALFCQKCGRPSARMSHLRCPQMPMILMMLRAQCLTRAIVR